MALRDKIRDRAQPFLDEGEQIEGVFSGQTTNPAWSLLSLWIVLIANGYRTVVVTDRRIIVFQTGRTSFTKLKSVLRELPRDRMIGPAKGLWWKSETLGEKLYVHKRFHKDVAEVDARLGVTGRPPSTTAAAPPPAPLPPTGSPLPPPIDPPPPG